MIMLEDAAPPTSVLALIHSQKGEIICETIYSEKIYYKNRTKLSNLPYSGICSGSKPANFIGLNYEMILKIQFVIRKELMAWICVDD